MCKNLFVVTPLTTPHLSCPQGRSKVFYLLDTFSYTENRKSDKLHRNGMPVGMKSRYKQNKKTQPELPHKEWVLAYSMSGDLHKRKDDLCWNLSGAAEQLESSLAINVHRIA